MDVRLCARWLVTRNVNFVRENPIWVFFGRAKPRSALPPGWAATKLFSQDYPKMSFTTVSGSLNRFSCSSRLSRASGCVA